MLEVRGLVKKFTSDTGDVNAVNDVSFSAGNGEFFTLLGPSGCGKSTTLRCIAGLEGLNSGEIELDGRIVASKSRFTPANERPVGMVFQSYAIWPHMTVLRNVTFPLTYRGGAKKGDGIPRKERRERGLEALRLVQLEHLADRRAPYLSGGQQQRVALARSLVSHPELLLLDEPLSNLDAKLREEMRFEIKELTTRLGITTIYVTHDQQEALSMSDRIAVLQDGRILQVGSPREIYLTPASVSVARFVGSVNLLRGELATVDGQWCSVKTGGGSVIKCRLVRADLQTSVDVMVRPELVDVKPEERVDSAEGLAGEEVNRLVGNVRRLLFAGDHVDCYVGTDDGLLRAKLPPDSDLDVGQKVAVLFSPDRCVAS